MTVSTLSAQEGDTAVPHPSTGLFSRKTLPIALQTCDLGVFLAETLPDRRTQGLCARTFAQNVLEKRVTMPHRARFRLKRARMRGSGAETRAFPIKMRAEYGLPGNSLIARRAAGRQQKQQRQRQGAAGAAGAAEETGAARQCRAREEREKSARAANLSVPVHGKKFLLYLHNYAITRKCACAPEYRCQSADGKLTTPGQHRHNN